MEKSSTLFWTSLIDTGETWNLGVVQLPVGLISLTWIIKYGFEVVPDPTKSAKYRFSFGMDDISLAAPPCISDTG